MTDCFVLGLPGLLLQTFCLFSLAKRSICDAGEIEVFPNAPDCASGLFSFVSTHLKTGLVDSHYLLGEAEKKTEQKIALHQPNGAEVNRNKLLQRQQQTQPLESTKTETADPLQPLTQLHCNTGGLCNKCSALLAVRNTMSLLLGTVVTLCFHYISA